jgi:hypothetical protein
MTTNLATDDTLVIQADSIVTWLMKWSNHLRTALDQQCPHQISQDVFGLSVELDWEDGLELANGLASVAAMVRRHSNQS